MKTMLFNPYTGTPRHPSDIASDPEGILLLDPDEPVKAAKLGADMSELMDKAVLTMPYELAMGDELSRMQFWSRVQLLYKEHQAALAALRSMPAEPVDKQQEIDTITELNHAQWLALGKASLLVAACNRLSGEAEEFDFDDGLGRGAPQAYWDEFEDALEQAAEAIDVANKTIHQDHIATPPTAPVLSDAEIDALEWQPSHDKPMTLNEGKYHFARAVERVVLGRASRGAK